MSRTADDRDVFVPGYDLNGKLLPDDVRECLRSDLLDSEAHTDEEILAFVDGWLLRQSEGRRAKATAKA